MSAIRETKANQFYEWEILLREFETLIAPVNAESQLEQLLDEFDHHQESWRENQKSRADDFNILRTMRLTRNELCHSDILAWLLDSRETHAQEKLGFQLFLKELNLPEDFAKKDYTVIREMSGDDSRLDIVVQAEGEFIIGIENKIDSVEGEDQTKREWKDLEKRKLNTPTEIFAFFLTPDGTKPICPHFQPLTWQVVANIFQRFSDDAEANLVGVFAKHYATILRHDIVPETEEE
jgi:hypothetical protein